MRVTHQLRDFITGDVTSVGYGGRHPNKILIKGRVTTRSAASLQEGLRRPIPSAFGNVLRVLPAVVRVVRRILEVGRVEPRVNKLGNSFETLGIQVVGGTTDLTIGWRRLGLSASRDICRTRTIEGLNPKVRGRSRNDRGVNFSARGRTMPQPGCDNRRPSRIKCGRHRLFTCLVGLLGHSGLHENRNDDERVRDGNERVVLIEYIF